LIGTLFTTYLFMKSTAVESTRFLADDLTSQLNTVYSLLEGMSEQPLIKDTSISVQERAASMKTYADAFGFWMIGVVDPDGTISSTLRPKTGKVQRGYIPRIMASGKREISDPFPAGATGDMTYSQFMPIKKDGKVVSICFVTTPLSLLSERVTRRDHTGNGYYLMLSSTGSLIAHPNPTMSLTHIRDLVAGERFLYGSSRETFLRDIKSDQPGTFISIFRNTLYFTAFMNYETAGRSSTGQNPADGQYMLLAFFTQTLLYTLLFVVLYRYGRTAISQELRPVDNILRQVEELNRSVNAADSITEEDVFNIINISRKGLYDALTGLPTRNLFRQRVNDTIEKMPGRLFGVFILDMDNLKAINDHLGHEAGDKAIRSFASTLKEFTERHFGLACRYGGDEFVLFIPLDTPSDASALARELLETQHGSIVGNDVVYAYGTSIGVSFYPLSGTFDEALHMADTALYSSKRSGKGTFTCLPSHAECL
ncbi:MAG: sensor domain-containing diguanylate cyclase, partial [Bilophila wadsworthia]